MLVSRSSSVLVSLTHAQSQAQTAVSAARGRAWVMPRTADGRPDLEGVWENNSAHHSSGPRQLADKPRLSDEELASARNGAPRTLFGPNAEATFGDALYLTLLADTRPAGLGATGSYSQNWLPDRYFEKRTSLIDDPADGKLPPPTPAGARLRAAAAGRFGRVGASAQDMSLQDRCIHYGFPDLFAAYMAVYRIVQTPEYVAIQLEKIHDTRIIPLDGRPHVSSALRNYLGDSRGKWEGDTLVVETTNFHPKGNPMGGYNVLSDETFGSSNASAALPTTPSNTRLPWTTRRCGPSRGRRLINWKRSRGGAARIRVPRGQLQSARDAVGRPGRRSGGKR
jgi:hypothetical protein